MAKEKNIVDEVLIDDMLLNGYDVKHFNGLVWLLSRMFKLDITTMLDGDMLRLYRNFMVGDYEFEVQVVANMEDLKDEKKHPFKITARTSMYDDRGIVFYSMQERLEACLGNARSKPDSEDYTLLKDFYQNRWAHVFGNAEDGVREALAYLLGIADVMKKYEPENLEA